MSADNSKDKSAAMVDGASLSTGLPQVEKKAQAIIETPEPASVSKFLAKFDRPDNVALMPDKSLTAKLNQKGGANPETTDSAKGESQDSSSFSSPPQLIPDVAPIVVPETTEGDATAPAVGEDGSPSLVSETTKDDSSPPQVDHEVTPSVETATTDETCKYLVDSPVVSLPFANEKAAKPLRVCCFGSSSSSTPESYLGPAAEVGYLLAKRGHTCVNGAGSFGCMAAMNDGAAAGNGHIVGVIHEIWLVDGGDEGDKKWGVPEAREGAHSVFDGCTNAKGGVVSDGEAKGGPLREMLVAGGKDLQERKRLLVEGTHGLIVLPGGPGTWDELWEMACARNIGLSHLPIVCVNINGFYDPFRQMLERAWKDQLTKFEPKDLVHFVNTAEEAVKWVEEVQNLNVANAASLKERKGPLTVQRNNSVLGSPAVRSVSSVIEWPVLKDESLVQWTSLCLALGTGLALGFLLSERLKQ